MATVELVAYTETDELAEAIRRDGFAYMPGVLNGEEISTLREQIERIEPNPRANDRAGITKRAVGLQSEEVAEFRESHTKVLFNRDAYFLQFLDRAPVADVADAVMGDDCHIIGMTGWITGPGRVDQQLHSDYQPIELPEGTMDDPRVEIPVFVATAHYYLDDIHEGLGPTKFVPGSHRAGRAPREDETEWNGTEEQSLICGAGDVVLFRSEVWHRGSANTSNQTRYLMQVHYARRMVVQKFPPYLDFQFDPDIVARASSRQRRYLGEHAFSNYD